MTGDVRDNFRVFLRCRIKSRAFDSDIMNNHDEKVNEYEEYLDQFQRDQMIVKGYNLYPTSDGVDCKQFEEEWDDDRQDLMLLDVANRLQEEQRFIHKDRYIYILSDKKCKTLE